MFLDIFTCFYTRLNSCFFYMFLRVYMENADTLENAQKMRKKRSDKEFSLFEMLGNVKNVQIRHFPSCPLFPL